MKRNTEIKKMTREIMKEMMKEEMKKECFTVNV
jgi:hypothetical protein